MITAPTRREKQILELVTDGMGTDEIAAHLVISPATVRNHIQSAMTKLHAQTRLQAVVAAIRAGIVTVPDQRQRDADVARVEQRLQADQLEAAELRGYRRALADVAG